MRIARPNCWLFRLLIPIYEIKDYKFCFDFSSIFCTKYSWLTLTWGKFSDYVWPIAFWILCFSGRVCIFAPLTTCMTVNEFLNVNILNSLRHHRTYTCMVWWTSIVKALLVRKLQRLHLNVPHECVDLKCCTKVYTLVYNCMHIPHLTPSVTWTMWQSCAWSNSCPGLLPMLPHTLHIQFSLYIAILEQHEVIDIFQVTVTLNTTCIDATWTENECWNDQRKRMSLRVVFSAQTTWPLYLVYWSFK